MLKKLQNRKQKIVKEISNSGDLLKGSVTIIRHRCGNPKCKCATDGEKHPGIYFTTKINGKSRLIYLGKKKKVKAEKMIQNHKRLKGLIEELTEVNMELLKQAKVEGVPDDRL